MVENSGRPARRVSCVLGRAIKFDSARLRVPDVFLSRVERGWQPFAKIIDGSPMIVVEHRPLWPDRLRRARLTEAEILSAARRIHGIERLARIKFAILDASGDI